MTKQETKKAIKEISASLGACYQYFRAIGRANGKTDLLTMEYQKYTNAVIAQMRLLHRGKTIKRAHALATRHGDPLVRKKNRRRMNAMWGRAVKMVGYPLKK